MNLVVEVDILQRIPGLSVKFVGEGVDFFD